MCPRAFRQWNEMQLEKPKDGGGGRLWPEELQPLQPEATGAVMEVTKWLKPLIT
jgi:hypothetical protein